MSSSPRQHSPSSPASSKISKIPQYITDPLRDPDLLLEHWAVLAELENQRRQSAQESLVRTRYVKPPEIARYSIAEAAAPENRNRNRYTNIAPFDINAVRVGEEELGEGEGLYLNASWVRERAGGALWIASQAPLPNTHYEFLALCTDITPAHKRVRTIVQLTPWVEKRFQAAHPYFPDELGDNILITRMPEPTEGPLASKSRLRVTVARKQHIPDADCIVRNLEIRYDDWAEGESPVFEVRHVAFDSWADHGVPNSTSAAYWLAVLADRLNRTPLTGKSVDPAPPPILVHCSAGVGRTGTFIAMSSLMRKFGLLEPASRPDWDTYVPEHSALGAQPEDWPEDDQVVQEVNALREQRVMMVQMPEQLEFIYGLLALALAGKLEGELPEVV